MSSGQLRSRVGSRLPKQLVPTPEAQSRSECDTDSVPLAPITARSPEPEKMPSSNLPDCRGREGVSRVASPAYRTSPRLLNSTTPEEPRSALGISPLLLRSHSFQALAYLFAPQPSKFRRSFLIASTRSLLDTFQLS